MAKGKLTKLDSDKRYLLVINELLTEADVAFIRQQFMVQYQSEAPLIILSGFDLSEEIESDAPLKPGPSEHKDIRQQAHIPPERLQEVREWFKKGLIHD